MTNLEAMRIAKMFIENSGELVCWTEIKAAAKTNHCLLQKNGDTFDIFGRDIRRMKFRKNGRIYQ